MSAARAPQYRLNHQPGPEPDEHSFLEELRRLEGTPRDVLDNPELMRLALPALRADANLFRNYVYHPAGPLPLPVHAYGGMSDPGVQCEQLDRWREQTTREFSLRQFEGGHFYIQHTKRNSLPRCNRSSPEERSGRNYIFRFCHSPASLRVGSTSFPASCAHNQINAVDVLKHPATTPIRRGS